jgi:hypothetical protein
MGETRAQGGSGLEKSNHSRGVFSFRRRDQIG